MPNDQRERMNVNPMMCMNPIHSNQIPWLTITRHTSALFFYLFAATQWPGNTVKDVFHGQHAIFGYNLSSWLFTLLVWTALLYHYTISWGRVEILFKKAEVRARGWVVKNSQKAHRILMSLTLACSLLTLTKSVILEMIYLEFGNIEAPKFHSRLEFLKIDQYVSLFLFIYVLFRVIFEPTGLKRYKKSLSKVKVVDEEEGQQMNDSNKEIQVEECSICVSRWANRRLGCGHLLCCCCILEICTTTSSISLCPFCRQEIKRIRRLKVLSADDVTFQSCCSEPTMAEMVDRIIERENQDL